MESFYRIAEMVAADSGDTGLPPTDVVTVEKEEKEERPTGNRSHFSQLRPRDSRQGSLQTGEICKWECTIAIALSNTILGKLSVKEKIKTAAAHSSSLVQTPSASLSFTQSNHSCQTTSVHRFEFAWVT